MSPPDVRIARDDEAAGVAQVLTDAFGDEAGLNYWMRQDHDKERARRRFFEAAVRDVVHQRRQLWLATADGVVVGGAIWLAPGQKAYDFSPWRQLLITPLLLSIAGFAGARRGLALGEAVAALHPREPHAHLVYLGVAPAAQGRGVGSAILKHTLAPLDAAGVTSFLEATTERNVALYRRHGFEISGEIERPGLHLRAMVRASRA